MTSTSLDGKFFFRAAAPELVMDQFTAKIIGPVTHDGLVLVEVFDWSGVPLAYQQIKPIRDLAGVRGKLFDSEQEWSDAAWPGQFPADDDDVRNDG